MKGILTKTEQGWVVNYNYSVNKNDWYTLPLHPDFIEMMDTCFTSKFSQEVEFEIVTETYEDGKGCTYAKVIKHSVDTNEMINQITDVKNIKRSAVTFLIEQIEGRGYFSNEFPLKRKTIEHIIKRALEIEQEIQETLYTEEQVREAYWLGVNRGNGVNVMSLDNFIQSLKQHKQ